MGWETRNGRRYFYEARREYGRVVERYIGTGPLAETVSQLNALDAERRKWTKVERDLAAARKSRPGRSVKVIATADAVLAVWLPACDWHRPNRGPWRRKRVFVMGDLVTLAERKPLETWDSVALWRQNGDIPAELLPKEGEPKPAAVTAHLAGHPAAVALYGDLSRRVVARPADAAGGDGTLTAAAIKERAAALRRALAGDAPNPVELLLAERAVVCRTVCHQYELLYYSSLDKSRSVKDHDFHERRIAAAHRRLLSSLNTLAAVRRMKLPDLLAVVQMVGQPTRVAETHSPKPG